VNEKMTLQFGWISLFANVVGCGNNAFQSIFQAAFLAIKQISEDFVDIECLDQWFSTFF